MEHLKKKAIWTLVIVIIAFLTSRWLAYDFLSISYFAPMEKASDFQVSDFYNIVADGREVRTLDSQIVIVSIDGCSREQIANAVEQIDFCAPKAVGLDIFFSYPGHNDSCLISVLSDCENLVLPAKISHDSRADSLYGSFFYNQLPPDRIYGAVNLSGSNAQSVIRDFRPYFHIQTDTVENFAVALARIADPGLSDILHDRRKDMEIIYYPSREFEVIKAVDILNNKEYLQDKIVLIGAVNDLSDKHVTPVDSQMSGVFIHAYTLSTILYQNYITETGKVIDWIIAIFLCTLVVFINVWLWPYDFGALLVRIVQMVLLYLIVYSGCRLYINHQICVNFSFPLLMVGLGLLVTDIIYGLVGSYHFIRIQLDKKKNFHTAKHKKDEKINSDTDN